MVNCRPFPSSERPLSDREGRLAIGDFGPQTEFSRRQIDFGAERERDPDPIWDPVKFKRYVDSKLQMKRGDCCCKPLLQMKREGSHRGSCSTETAVANEEKEETRRD
ncbi:hypothetical protein ACH5RR_039308 [Cinchona calisaya]|uniref:Uncharacterized protein n=1 Tax=Cinchona calisaya TaxID=153742 RepID=A0ABD2Y340_9GENT